MVETSPGLGLRISQSVPTYLCESAAVQFQNGTTKTSQVDKNITGKLKIARCAVIIAAVAVIRAATLDTARVVADNMVGAALCRLITWVVVPSARYYDCD